MFQDIRPETMLMQIVCTPAGGIGLINHDTIRLTGQIPHDIIHDRAGISVGRKLVFCLQVSKCGNPESLTERRLNRSNPCNIRDGTLPGVKRGNIAVLIPENHTMHLPRHTNGGDIIFQIFGDRTQHLFDKQKMLRRILKSRRNLCMMRFADTKQQSISARIQNHTRSFGRADIDPQ